MVLMSFTIAALLMSVAAALCHLHMNYTLAGLSHSAWANFWQRASRQELNVGDFSRVQGESTYAQPSVCAAPMPHLHPLQGTCPVAGHMPCLPAHHTPGRAGMPWKHILADINQDIVRAPLEHVTALMFTACRVCRKDSADGCALLL